MSRPAGRGQDVFLDVSVVKRMTENRQRETELVFGKLGPWATPKPSQTQTPNFAHCHAITQLRNSSNGMLFSSSRDSTLRKWVISATPLEPSYILVGHNNWINDFVLIEADDRHDVIVSVSSDKTVKVWDIYKDYYCRIEEVPKVGKRLQIDYTRVEDKIVENYLCGDVSSQSHAPPIFAPLASFDTLHQDQVQAVSVNTRDVNQVATVSVDGSCAFFDLNALNVISQVCIRLRLRQLESLSFRKEDQFTYDDAFAASQELHAKYLYPSSSQGLWSVDYSPSGNEVVVGSAVGDLFTVDKRLQKVTLSLTAHLTCIRRVKYLDDFTIITASSDCTARLWDIRMIKTPLCEMEDHLDSVLSLTISDDRSYIYTGGRDGLSFGYDINKLRKHQGEGELVATHFGPVTSLHFTSDTLWSGAASGLISSWRQGEILSECAQLSNCRMVANSTLATASQGDSSSGDHVKLALALTWRPELCILPIMRQKKIVMLQDQIRALLLGLDNIVSLYDLSSLTPKRVFAPDLTLEALKVQIIQEPVMPWCTCDVVLGRLRLSLDKNSYLQGILRQKHQDANVHNLGQDLLLLLFKNCIKYPEMTSVLQQVVAESPSVSHLLISIYHDCGKLVSLVSELRALKSKEWWNDLPRAIQAVCMSNQRPLSPIVSSGCRVEILARSAAFYHDSVAQLCEMIRDRLRHEGKVDQGAVSLVLTKKQIPREWSLGIVKYLLTQQWPPPRTPLIVDYAWSDAIQHLEPFTSTAQWVLE